MRRTPSAPLNASYSVRLRRSPPRSRDTCAQTQTAARPALLVPARQRSRQIGQATSHLCSFATIFASRLLVQCIKAVHFGHVSPPPRAHILCTGVRVSSENREPHALHVNTGGAAGPFLCWFETIGCGGLGGTFKIPTRSVSRLLVLGAFLYVLLRARVTTCLVAPRPDRAS